MAHVDLLFVSLADMEWTMGGLSKELFGSWCLIPCFRYMAHFLP